MTAQIYEAGKEYWSIVSRVRKHNFRALMWNTAQKELNHIIATNPNNGVRKKAIAFLSHNRPTSPSNLPEDSGPRLA